MSDTVTPEKVEEKVEQLPEKTVPTPEKEMVTLPKEDFEQLVQDVRTIKKDRIQDQEEEPENKAQVIRAPYIIENGEKRLIESWPGMTANEVRMTNVGEVVDQRTSVTFFDGETRKMEYEDFRDLIRGLPVEINMEKSEIKWSRNQQGDEVPLIEWAVFEYQGKEYKLHRTFCNNG